MRAGDCDRVAEPHEFRKHLGALHDRHDFLPCRDDFRIGFIDRAGDHNCICVFDIVRSVADEYGRALFFEAHCLFTGLQIRALYRVAKAQHDFSNARHAGAADTDEMDRVNAAHAGDHDAAPASSRHIDVIRCRESGLDNARALAARDCRTDLSHNQLPSSSARA